MGPRLRESQGGEGGATLFALRFPVPSGGFSLLELLITVIIVGILAALALPNFGKAVEKAKVKDAQSALAAIAAAERVYRLDQGAYGSLRNLVDNRYVSEPNQGMVGIPENPPPPGPNWTYETSNVTTSTFTTTATRTEGGYNGNTIIVDQNFTGADIAEAPYNGRTYAGDHALRD